MGQMFIPFESAVYNIINCLVLDLSLEATLKN